MKRLTRILLLGTACSLIASAATAEETGFFDQWSIDGYNTARGDIYDIDGNTLASPFPFNGFHGYDEFGLNAARQYSPYERLNVSLQGVVSSSDYRSVDNGIVPERIQLLYENGETEVPFRVQAGDFYAGISYRTLQRSLKGASIEVQPFSDRNRSHSIMFFSGVNQPTYRSFDYDNDMHSGVSWLIEDRQLGRASFNVIHSYQDEATPILIGNNNSQFIYSAALESPFQLAAQNLIFEGELSYFDGDYALVNNQYDLGVFAQLSGRSISAPLDYRLRYERYGTDYRPNGAISTPDRQSYEAHAGWRFDWGTYLRARVQRYDDSFDSANKIRTDLIGTNLSGPFLNSLVTGLNGNIDIYQQKIDDEFNTIDRDTDTLNASFNAPIYDNWNGQLTLFAQDTDDNLATNADMTIKQTGLGVFFPVRLAELRGTVNPGLALRTIDNANFSDSREIHPTINMNLSNESHRINANYGILNQNRISGSSFDLATQTAGLEYAYMMDRHEVGFNGSYYERDVNGGLDTDAWRAGLYWTVRFNKPANTSLSNGARQTATLSGGQVNVPPLELAGLTLLQQLEPGDQLNRATALLKEQGFTDPTSREDLKIYEASLITEVIERQRIALAHDGQRVVKAGLVIDVTDTGSPRSVEQLYERVKQIIIRQYGTPDNFYEEGQFSNNVVDDINSERVIRVLEWDTPEGTLRYGMPRRMDGQLRIELQHASSFGSPRNTLWSLGLY